MTALGRLAPGASLALRSVALCGALLGAVPPFEAWGAPGDPGLVLELGANGRALGMGGAHVAVADDATSLYYNPAGLGHVSGQQVGFMHAALFEGASYDYLAYAQQTGRGVWGAQMMRLSAGGVEGRDAENNVSGSVSYAETGLGIGYGFRGLAGGRLALGSSFKMISRSLGSVSNRLYGLDVGVRFLPRLGGGRLALGAVASNMMGVRQGDTSDALPRRVKLGVSGRLVDGLILTADVSHTGELEIGTEYGYRLITFRAGFADQGPTFGSGVRLFESWKFDFALQNNATLGNSARVSGAYQFGRAKARERETARVTTTLGSAEAALAERRYVDALALYDRTVEGAAPQRSGERWERLRTLVRELGLPQYPEAAKELRDGGEQGGLGLKAVRAFMDKRDEDALLLAAAAAGTDARREVFGVLLQGIEKLTFQKASPEDITSVPRLVAMKMTRVVAEFKSRRFELAVKACEQALLLAPDSPVAHERLGSVLFALGQKGRALESWKESLRLKPDNAVLKDFLKRVGAPLGLVNE
ncbi:MAG: UPF0164 family protein [Elusimicrobia bacterium]|nr:UPF0164 family protein [Elusimicrobiota bacterium]